MLELIIWLGLMLCPNPFHTIEDHGSCNLIHVNSFSTSADDTGGETGGNPKPPIPTGN